METNMSRIGRIAAAIAFVLASTNAFASISKGPYLLFTGQNTSMDVAWQSSATESNTVKWGTDTTYGLGTAASTEYDATTHQHRFTVSGLQPGTKYYYQVDGAAGSFVTAPAAAATAVKILSTGDTRSYPANQETVAARMRAAYASDPAYQTLVLHDGDWVSADGDSNWTTEWFPTNEPNMLAIKKEVPYVGNRGNHESGGTYFKRYYPMPYVAGFYWSFDYGPVHVTVVDQYTTYTSGSAQYSWIQNDLASTTKPWKIVMLHEPGWTAGGSHPNNATVQTALQPLFEQYKVDFVIGGHNHYYARAVVNGVQHFTNGGGGADLYAPQSGQPNIVIFDQSFSYMELDVNGGTAVVTARRANGTVIETLTVSHTAPGNQPPIANAGPDQAVTDSDGNGFESVILDGTASRDPDGTIASYAWKDGTTQLANTVTAAVDLAVGTHDVTLTVTDDLGATGSDSMVVTVNPNPATQPPGAFSLLKPTNAATRVSRTATAFDWGDSSNATSYAVVVSTSSTLSNPVINVSGLTGSAYTSTVTLGSRTKYYWQVTAMNAYGSTKSSLFSFTTAR
jgi:hypothetical protein